MSSSLVISSTSAMKSVALAVLQFACESLIWGAFVWIFGWGLSGGVHTPHPEVLLCGLGPAAARRLARVFG